jgi:uncharacterized membrane protein YeiH
MLLTTLDLIGTFVFALSGGIRAVENRMDPFGVVFLSFVAAVTGGIMRDVLIGALPPVAMQSEAYVILAIIAGTTCFYAYDQIIKLARPVAVFDAIGLGLFCVVGAGKALGAGLSPIMAALLGMVSAIGGGMAADILTARPPMVLQKEIYALAALAGASVYTLGSQLGLSDALLVPAGALLATGLRLIAINKNWHLPRAKSEL